MNAGECGAPKVSGAPGQLALALIRAVQKLITGRDGRGRDGDDGGDDGGDVLPPPPAPAPHKVLRGRRGEALQTDTFSCL